jgi:hypothetical protein
VFFDEDVPVSQVRFTVKRSDRFYVVIVTKGKQYDRDIELNLRVLKQ